MEHLTQKAKEVSEEIHRMKKEVADTLRNEMRGEFAKIFEDNPELRWFSWVQYTPYFNDGESCVFSVIDSIRYQWGGNPDDLEEIDYYDFPEISKWDIPYIRGEKESSWRSEIDPTEVLAADALEPVINLLSAIDDDIFLEVFGDHAMVIVTKDGIDIEEYEHD